MKAKHFAIIIIVLALATLGHAKAPNEVAVSFKLGLLCQDNPQMECSEVVDYCQESLERGRDCYIIN